MKRVLFILCINICALAQAQDLRTAETLLEKGQYAKVIDITEDLIRKAEEGNDFTGLIKARAVITEAYLGAGEEEKAYECLASTLAMFTRKQLHCINYFSNGQALSQIATIYSESGDVEEARLYARAAANLVDPWNKDNTLTLRFSKLAKLDIDAGDYEEALKSVEEGLRNKSDLLSHATHSAIDLQKVICLEALGREDEVPAVLEEIEDLIARTSDKMLSNHSSAVFLRMASYSLEKRDTTSAVEYMQYALKNALDFNDRLREAETYRYMEGFYRDLDKDLSEHYHHMADSLSYEPYLRRMAGLVAFNTFEFARREHRQKVKVQSLHITLLICFTALIAMALLTALIFLRSRVKTTQLQKEQISALKKSLEQHEKLLAIANAVANPEARKDLSKIAGKIINDLPIKLTAREYEVAKLAAQGLMNKEISYKLGISTRTVETHRNKVYRKLDINNVAELKYYLNAIESSNLPHLKYEPYESEK